MGGTLILGESCIKIGSGATPRGGKESYLDSGPFTLVRSQNVYNHGFQFGGIAYISTDQADKLSNVILEPLDVLINITGDSVARVCQVHTNALPGRVNQHVAIIRPDPCVLDATFLRYWLVAPSTQNLLLGLASAGATRPALTKSMLEGLEVPAPPLKEQHTIANVLSALDDKIELNRRTSETLEAMAQATFKDWFVDFGPVRRKMQGETDPPAILGGLLPSRERATVLSHIFPNSLDGDGFPVGWKRGQLSDIAHSASNTVNPADIPSSTPYIGLEHMPRRSIMLSNWGHSEAVTSNKTRFRKGQVLFGKLRPYFHKVGIAALDGVCSTDIVVLEATRAWDAAFVATCVSSDAFVAFPSVPISVRQPSG